MKQADNPSDYEKSKSVLRVIAYVSLAVIVIIAAFGVIDALRHPNEGVGSGLVNFEFPSPDVSPVYFKPITILYIAGALFMYSGLELNRGRIASFSPAWKTLIKAFAFIVAAVFAYEVSYNFVFWSGQIAADSIRGTLNPDVIANPFPHLANPVNVVFASRLFALFLICGLYVFYFMTKLEPGKTSGVTTAPSTSS